MSIADLKAIKATLERWQSRLPGNPVHGPISAEDACATLEMALRELVEQRGSIGELRSAVELVRQEMGCGDHGCHFRPAKGIGTNGGCHCLDGLQRRKQGHALRMLFTVAKKVVGEP